MAKDIGNVTTWKTYPADGHEDPFATFNFKYRSRRKSYGTESYTMRRLIRLVGALKSLLLIPRTPSPIPLEDRDFETLTQEERDEFARGQHVSSLVPRVSVNSPVDRLSRLASAPNANSTSSPTKQSAWLRSNASVMTGGTTTRSIANCSGQRKCRRCRNVLLSPGRL